jgi:cytosine/uracil/thiamine/allantoin permease
LAQEEFRDMAVSDEARLARIKAEVMSSSLYNYGLFFTFFVAGITYLLLSLIPGRAPEPSREPETT